jgi:hypothetical protein
MLLDFGTVEYCVYQHKKEAEPISTTRQLIKFGYNII